MENNKLKINIDLICKFSEEMYDAAVSYQNSLIKPPKSLGILEELACKICGIKNNLHPNINKKRLLVFSSDNGVFEENVSSCPQNITIDQTINLTLGITGASSMAKYFNDEVFVYDLGVNNNISDYINKLNIDNKTNIKNNVINKKISYSTKNMLKEPAMSNQELYNAINVGIEAVENAKNDNVDIMGVGEMGICNTTTSTAILQILSGLDIDTITGRGAGLTDKQYDNKKFVVKNSIDRAFDSETKKLILNNQSKYVFDIIKEVGGYDIAAMVGAYLACSYYKIPFVVDGYIGIVAALCSYYLNNNVLYYMFLSHDSLEPGYKYAKNILSLKTLFNLEMRLGEGSGCIVAFRIIEAALAMHNNMKTFNDAKIDDSYLEGIKF